MSAKSSPLTVLEYLAILAIIMIWGVNNAAAKVATAYLPPMLVGGLRFAAALVFLFPLIRPPFPDWKRVAAITLLTGPIHFGMIYVAFGLGQSLSPLVVASQLWIPFTRHRRPGGCWARPCAGPLWPAWSWPLSGWRG